MFRDAAVEKIYADKIEALYRAIDKAEVNGNAEESSRLSKDLEKVLESYSTYTRGLKGNA
ncbi:MAG: hypothetical protein P4N59_29580 [Negativicutes bacterium]|nr:hypothetical protein [Negativicutes bacterium]